MSSLPRRRTLATAGTLALTAGLVMTPGTAWAHDRAPAAGDPGTSVPLVTSPNVSLVSSVPLPGTISMEWARTGDFAYVSSLTTVTVLDTKDPAHPVRRGTLPVAQFENESMTYGERHVDGRLVRFVVLGVDAVEGSPTDPSPDHVNVGGREAVFVDVTDPDRPFIRSRVTTTTSTHTVQCVSQAECRYAYTAGTDGKFSVLDLTDLDAPRELRTAVSSASGAAGPSSPFSDRGAGHYWDFDGVVGWHTGSGGAQAFDVSDPTDPKPVQATNAKGRQSPYNDFILHNSQRPNATRFRPGLPPSVKNGNVLLVTEEDYANDGDEVACDRAGTLQTWYVPDLDGAAYRLKNPTGALADKGTVRPLDITNAPAEFGGGVTTPAAAFCSAHWFDVHQDGFVAQGWYGGGLRIMDVRDARNIAQYGFVTSLATEVWDAYWVPQRTKARVVVPGKKTDLVYTADAVRGVEVYRVALPGSGSSALAGAAGAVPGSGTTAAVVGLGAALVLGAAGALRRRAGGSATIGG